MDNVITEDDGNTISDLTVFLDQAFVSRRARVEATKGLNRFLLEIQAFHIDKDSPQATVYGDGAIISVQYKELPVKEAVQNDIRQLEEQIIKQIRQKKWLETEKEIIKKKTSFLDSINFFADTELPKELKTAFPSSADLQSMLDFMDRHYKDFAEKDHDLNCRFEEIDEDIAVLENRLKQFHRPKSKSRKCIEVLFESAKEQEIEIKISYVAGDASWEPVYKVDVPEDLSGITMTMFARIKQKTGENWKDANLSVTNAVPVRGISLPELYSWQLHLPSPPQVMLAAGPAEFDDAPKTRGLKRARSKMVDETVQEEVEDYEHAEPAPQAHFAETTSKELPLAFEYELPHPVTIPHGDDETILPIFTKRIQSAFFIYTVPQIDAYAYLVCKLGEDIELLAGKLNTYFGGRFVDGARLGEKKAGEDLLLNLGVERGIKVRREKLYDKQVETFFGKVERTHVAREIGYRIVIENMKVKAERVQLVDNLPVSQTDRIQIKGLETSPKPSEKDYKKREGVMMWDFEIKANATKEITINFMVKHHRDIHPMGL